MILKLLYVIYSKSVKITLSVCVAVGKFVCDVNGGKPVHSFFVLISFPDLLWTKTKARSGQIQFAPRDHLSGMWQGRPVRMSNNDKFPKRSRSSKGRFTRYDSVANNKLTTSLWHDLGIFARISKFRRFHETKQINPKWGRKVFSTTWPDLVSKTFATVGVF